LQQLSKTGSYNANAVLSAVDSAYTNNTMEARVTIFTLRNPWATVARNQAALVLDGWLSQHFVSNSMSGNTATQDPRLPRITNLTRAGNFRGTRNGVGRTGTGTTNDESYLVLTGFYSGDASPLFICTYEEIKFIEAEAALRAGNATRAYNAYLEGIRANMNKVGVAAADRDSYIARTTVGVGSSALNQSRIMEEKYKALFLSPVTFDDARRFNWAYQGFQLPQNAILTTPIRRLDYPSSERLRNNKTPNIADLTQRLWWDIN
jgi:hypothetical protein